MRTGLDLRHVTFVLTSQCNLRCRYCYQNAKKPGRLSPEAFQAALQVCLQSGNRAVEVLFMGGEPLLEFPLIRRAVEFLEDRCPEDMKIRFIVSTNGTLLTDKIVDFLEDHSFATQLSFDGVSTAQDLRGPATFTVLDRWLDRLQEDHPVFFRQNVQVNLTVVPETVAQLPVSIDYLVKKRTSKISIQPSITSDSRWRAEAIDELDAVFGVIFNRCKYFWEETRQIPLLLFQETTTVPPSHGEEWPMCGILAGDLLTVDVDGQVYRCPRFVGSCQEFRSPLQLAGQEAVRVGAIHAPDFLERLVSFPEAARRTGLFNRKEEKYSSYGRCRDCRYLEQCLICPAATMNRLDNNDPNRVSDFCCAFNRVTLKYREQFPKQPSLRDRVRGTPELVAEMKRWQALAEAARAARTT